MYKTTFPRVLDTIIRPYLRSRSRKPYTTQVREMAALYRAYRYVPYHYFKHDLYSRAAPEKPLDHIPPRILYAYIRSLNPDEGVRSVRNKITFRQVLSARGLRWSRKCSTSTAKGGSSTPSAHRSRPPRPGLWRWRKTAISS